MILIRFTNRNKENLIFKCFDLDPVLIDVPILFKQITGPDCAVAMSSANRLVGTGFASRYRLRPRAGI